MDMPLGRSQDFLHQVLFGIRNAPEGIMLLQLPPQSGKAISARSDGQSPGGARSEPDAPGMNVAEEPMPPPPPPPRCPPFDPGGPFCIKSCRWRLARSRSARVFCTYSSPVPIVIKRQCQGHRKILFADCSERRCPIMNIQGYRSSKKPVKATFFSQNSKLKGVSVWQVLTCLESCLDCL